MLQILHSHKGGLTILLEFGTKVIRLQVIEIKVNLNKIPGNKRCRFGYTAVFCQILYTFEDHL